MNDRVWGGEFGDAYTDRNRVDWKERLPFWNEIIGQTRPRSVLEVGCNAGWNLRAIRGLDHRIDLRGVDLNEKALSEAADAGLEVFPAGASEVGRIWPNGYDLVFTVGVLIHIAPSDLERCMRSIAAASRNYVLAVEYEADDEQEIEYRSERGLLWKRPFGKLYEAMDLKRVRKWPAGDGFDNCTAWLMEKT